MKNSFDIKIISSFLFLFIFIVGDTLYTLVFNSIVFVYYGGLSYSLLNLAPIFTIGLGIAFLIQPILSPFNTKSKIIQFSIILFFACISSYIYHSVIFLAFNGFYYKSVFSIFKSGSSYVYIVAFVVQILFLKIKVSKESKKLNFSKSIVKTLLFQFLIILIYFLSNFENINNSYERRMNKPDYKKGNSKILRIIVDESCGVIPELYGDRYIIEIPENGIVIVQSKEVFPYYLQLFFTNKDKERQELHFFDSYGEDDETADQYERTNEVKGITRGVHGHFLGKIPDGTGYSSGAPTAIEYYDFIIKSTDFPYVENLQEDIEIRTKKTINKCRGTKTNDWH